MEGTLRARVSRVVDTRWFQNTIITVIILNAITLGVETYRDEIEGGDAFFATAEHLFVVFFTFELALKLYARGLSFFRDPWNWFDTAVVAIALVPSSGSFSVLRLLRILRILRLISVMPQMRVIVSALFRSVPGLGTVIGLLLIIVYTGAVLGEKMFHEADPERFGDLGTTLYSMFILLTTEDWPDVAEPVLEQHPMAWIFFVGYIVISAFIVLNLVIGVIVTSMQHEVSEKRWEEDQELELRQHEAVMTQLETLTTQVTRLSAEVRELRVANGTPETPGDEDLPNPPRT